MNIINVDINFKDGINKLTGINLITGDYASTKMVFNFDRIDGTKVLEMKNPSGQLVYDGEILNNEVLLCAVEEGHNYSIFNQEGRYIYEVSLYKGDSKLTSVKGELPVQKEQVIIDGEIVEPYLPIFDQLMQDIDSKIEEVDSKIEEVDTKLETIDSKIEEVDTAIEETNNLNIDIDKEDKETTITLTKKDGTTKTESVLDGKDLQFVWRGTELGIKTSDMQDYVYTDLQGVQGEKGDMGSPFTIKKTYSTESAMIADYDNMNVGDYVMIDGDIEVQENATLWVKEETPAPTTKWHYLADFSGASGIQGETGLTPNIQIGTVTSGATPSVTRSGTNENPILNFVLQKGDKGDTGNTGATGATGNGIASIVKTSTSGLVDTYTITYTDGTTTTYEVTNGEDGEVTQEQLDETNAMNELLLDQIPKGTATGQDITLNDSSNLPIKSIEISGNTSQDATTGKNKLNIEENCTFTQLKTITTPIQAGTYYVNRLSVSGGGTDGIWIRFGSNSINVGLSSGTFPKEITLTQEETSINLYSNGVNYNASAGISATINQLMVSSGSSDTYEPYTGGIASPNPDYPQEVKVVKGDNVILERGKQLWDEVMENGGYSGSTGEKVSTNYQRNANYIVIPSNTELTLSKPTGKYTRVYFYDKNKTFISAPDVIYTNRISSTFTTPSNAVYMNIQIDYGSSIYNNDIFVELGDTATDYEPYNGTDYPLTLGTLEYSKIGNYEDEFIIPKNNSFDKVSATLNNSYYTLNNDGTITTNITYGSEGRRYLNNVLLNAGTYTLSFIPNLATGNSIRLSIRNSDNSTDIYNDSKTITNGTLVSQTFTLIETTNIGICIEGTSNNYKPLTLNDVMINKGTTALPYEPYNNGKWYLKKKERHISLAIADMNNDENYPGWKNVSDLLNDYPNKNTLLSNFTDYMCNITNKNNAISVNTVYLAGGGTLFFNTGVIALTQTQWKEQYPNLVFELHYGLQNPEYTLLNDTLQTQLDNIWNMKTNKNVTNISITSDDLKPYLDIVYRKDLETLLGG